jgi:pyruvate dehydrogenase E1 component alpha subunit
MASAKTKYSKEQYLDWFSSMTLQRKFEEKCAQLYGQQKIRGFLHLNIGQEACSTGVATALEYGDKHLTSYRDHGQPLALGTDPSAIMAELFGKVTGTTKGKGGSMHIFDKNVGFMGGWGIVGGQIPMGAGIAFAEKYQKTGKVCICYFGDGAARIGAFHETFNMAMTWKLPVIFVVENNGYAMGTSVARTSNVRELYTMGEAYDIPSEPVDGMDVEAVYEAVGRAAKRARAGEGPTYLEFKTYRYRGHSMSDPQKYRTKEEVEEWKMRDPIEMVRHKLVSGKMATEKDLEAIEAKHKATVEAAVKFAEESPNPPAKDAFKDIYADAAYPFLME